MVRTRIAPTPSGYLHIGNALNFVLTWLWARKAGGSVRLRIDDLDAPRIRPEYLEDIFETLEWLGLDWDEGPFSVTEHEQKFSQTHRQDYYRAFLEELIATGKVFACTCSRKSLEKEACNCFNKAVPLNSPEAALRVLTPDSVIVIKDAVAGVLSIPLDKDMHNFVVRRKEGMVAYQVSSLADDLLYKVNLIIRGQDLLGSTAAQTYLATISGKTAFAGCSFYHHPLITDNSGQKLSKSAGSGSLRAMRAQGYTVNEFYKYISKLLGWPQPAITSIELLKAAQSGLPVFLLGR